jgi:hypothetical protein
LLGRVRREFARLPRIYAAAGAERHCHWVEGAGGHQVYADDA